jgi:uncharacterized protein (TIGR03067 family)
MRWLALLALTLAIPDRPAPIRIPVDPVKDELTRLNGVWAVVTYEYDGGKLDDVQVAAYPRLIMKDGAYRWANAQSGGDMKIDPTQRPKHVDYTHGPGPLRGKIQVGIYDLQGDIFRDCIGPVDGPRPNDFTVPAGSGRTLFVYRRVKD